MATKTKMKRNKAWLECPTDVVASHPKPNPLFTEYQTFVTRFLSYSMPVACAYCGKRRTGHWTQLVFFRVVEGFEKKIGNKVVVSGAFEATKGKELFPPLTPVCRSHILAPEIEPKIKQPKRDKQ